MGYHMTRRENLFGEDGIASCGLMPKHGERSDMVGDNRTTICFTTDLYNLPYWKKQLYPVTPSEELCVLSFDYNNVECIKGYKELSTNSIIPKEEIYIVTFYDSEMTTDFSFERLEEIISYNELHQSNYLKIGVHFSPLNDYMNSLKKSYQYVKK